VFSGSKFAPPGPTRVSILTLASRSPQRKAILEQLGVSFRVVAPDVEELTEGAPSAVVVENAVRKARAVEGERVLGVDTAVVVDGRLYGKPADQEEAGRSLERLSGRWHEVWSGVVLRERRTERSASACTRVRFRALLPADVEWYLATEEWRGRAGGYAIQGRGAALVASIEGDFWNVVGLPVPQLLELTPDLLRP